MNKTDIINNVAESTGYTKKISSDVVNAVFDEIEKALASGEPRVSISGFGSFAANIVPPKKMKSPLNDGGIIHAKKTSKIRFHASDKMKAVITKANKAVGAKKTAR